MQFLKKDENSKKFDSSTERKILKKIPFALLIGTIIPLLAVGAVHLYDQFNPSVIANQLPHAADNSTELFFYMMIGLIIFYWTMVLTVALACVIMIIMKGPIYTADSYPLSHKDRPSGQ
jgi:hypothetical protein